MKRTGLVSLLSHGTLEVVHITFICLSHMPLNFVSGIVLGPRAKSLEFKTGQFQYCLRASPIPLTQTHGNSRSSVWHFKLYALSTSCHRKHLLLGVNESMFFGCLLCRSEFLNLCGVCRSQEDPKDHTQNHSREKSFF
jgi:hypothetical protein